MLIGAGGALRIDTCIAVSIENLAIITAGRVPAISVRSGLRHLAARPDRGGRQSTAPRPRRSRCRAWSSTSPFCEQLDRRAVRHSRAGSHGARAARVSSGRRAAHRKQPVLVLTAPGDRLRRERCAHAGHATSVATRSRAAARRHRHAGIRRCRVGGAHRDNTLSVNGTRHPLRSELRLDRGQPRHCGGPGELQPTGVGHHDRNPVSTPTAATNTRCSPTR